jgi:4-hydroxybenzoate polyprenyltransferase
MFNTTTYELVFVIITSFFLSAGTCAYNNMTDKKEDSINKKSNMFVDSGLSIASVCFLLAFLSSLFLPFISILFSIFITATSIAYSFFKIKKYFLVKNFYSGVGTPQLFLLGTGSLKFPIILYYLLMSLFFFVGSLIADLRDYKGDKFVGVNTLPVCIGYERTKTIIYLSLTLLLVLVLQSTFSPISIFIIPMFVSVFKERIETAHSLGGTSLIFLTCWLGINRLLI